MFGQFRNSAKGITTSIYPFLKRHIKLLGFLLSIAVLAVTLLTDDELRAGFPNFTGVNWGYALYAPLLMCVSLAAEGFVVYYAQRRMGHGLTPWGCMRINALSRCYGALTPMNAASHPTLIAQLTKRGVPGGAAGSVGALRYTSFQTALVLIAALALIYGHQAGGVALKVAVIAGFVVNAAPGALLMLLTLNARAGTFVLGALCRPFRRRGERIKERTLKQYRLYREGLSALRVRDVCVLGAVALLQAGALLAVPAAACLACGGHAPLLDSALVAALLMIAVTAMPLPGGAGVAEGGFLALFSLYLPPEARVPAMLIWRGATYYFVIILGSLLHIPWRKQ